MRIFFCKSGSALNDLFGITDNDRDGDGLVDYRSTIMEYITKDLRWFQKMVM